MAWSDPARPPAAPPAAIPPKYRERPSSVVIRDVGPRDGLQSLDFALPTAWKADLVEGLAAAGLSRVEIGAFVSPRAVPTMSDSGEVLRSLRRRTTQTSYEALVPNLVGADRAVAAGVDAVVAVVSASDTFSRRNVHMGSDEAMRCAIDIAKRCSDAGVRFVASVATSFGCAYEGPVDVEAVVRLVERLAAGGYTEITLADTTGMAAPSDIRPMFDAAAAVAGPEVTLGLHAHDTRGLGLANVWAALEAGIRLFDASIGGLGGCPFSPGSTGNVATEDVVHMLMCAGIETGINLDGLLVVSRGLQQALGIDLPARLLGATPAWKVGPHVV
jgi:hydroxymethylglutaryl-CoA lyase